MIRPATLPIRRITWRTPRGMAHGKVIAYSARLERLVVRIDGTMHNTLVHRDDIIHVDN